MKLQLRTPYIMVMSSTIRTILLAQNQHSFLFSSDFWPHSALLGDLGAPCGIWGNARDRSCVRDSSCMQSLGASPLSSLHGLQCWGCQGSLLSWLGEFGRLRAGIGMSSGWRLKLGKLEEIVG